MKHFKLRTDLTKEFYGKTLFRIELTINCKCGKAGDLGGWVEKESNLSGNAWVSGNARVYGNALVSGNALVYGNARVYGNALVYDNARVYGDARVYGNAQVYCDARVEKYGQCVNITNLKHNTTLTPNLIIIGCKTWKTLEEFNRTHLQIGKENKYTDDEIALIAELVNSVMKRMEPINEYIEIDMKKAKELGVKNG